MAFSTVFSSCGNRSPVSGFSVPGPLRLEVSFPPTRLSSSASRLLRRRWNGSQLPGVSFECRRCIEGQTQEVPFPRPFLRCEGIKTPALPLRVGHGFDLHRLEEGYKLIVGGVTLEHDRGCVGHSDGDVVLHTVTDAILGALGEPDIGQLFSDKDPKWKGAASHVFLTEAVRRMSSRGYAIGNLDVTVILERPKMSPHKAAIKHNIAQLLHAPVDRINVKAKTHEKVDSLGENRSIACHAVVTLVLNTTPASSSSTASSSSSSSITSVTSAGSPSSESEPASAEVLSRLFLVIEGRKGADPSSSYTAKLLAAGIPKIAQKVGEEGVETVIEATCGTREKLVGESADLLYHLLVLWAARDIEPSAVWAELERRTGTSGIAEKAARPEQ